MKLPLVSLGLILAVGIATAQDHPSMDSARPAVLMQGLGNLHHPISTKSAEAQRFFDQGLTLVYAFNHDEAARSFQRAAKVLILPATL